MGRELRLQARKVRKLNVKRPYLTAFFQSTRSCPSPHHLDMLYIKPQWLIESHRTHSFSTLYVFVSFLSSACIFLLQVYVGSAFMTQQPE